MGLGELVMWKELRNITTGLIGLGIVTLLFVFVGTFPMTSLVLLALAAAWGFGVLWNEIQ